MTLGLLFGCAGNGLPGPQDYNPSLQQTNRSSSAPTIRGKPQPPGVPPHQSVTNSLTLHITPPMSSTALQQAVQQSAAVVGLGLTPDKTSSNSSRCLTALQCLSIMQQHTLPHFRPPLGRIFCQCVGSTAMIWPWSCCSTPRLMPCTCYRCRRQDTWARAVQCRHSSPAAAPCTACFLPGAQPATRQGGGAAASPWGV
jgi:hypothetical protein